MNLISEYDRSSALNKATAKIGSLSTKINAL